MITPIEIQSKTFKSGGLGYDKKDVDSFMREVLNSYEVIYRENMEMSDKINVLTEGINYYKTIEKTLQKALVLAEKTAEETKATAINVAKNIEKEAIVKSQMIVADAKHELEQIHNQTMQLIQQYEKYKAQFKNLAKVQADLLESEAFNIHIARLDTFINVNNNDNQKNQLADQVNQSYKNQMNATGGKNIDATKKAVKLNQRFMGYPSSNQEESNEPKQSLTEAEYLKNYVDALDQVSATSEEAMLYHKTETFSNRGQVGNANEVEEFDFVNLDEEYRS